MIAVARRPVASKLAEAFGLIALSHATWIALVFALGACSVQGGTTSTQKKGHDAPVLKTPRGQAAKFSQKPRVNTPGAGSASFDAPVVDPQTWQGSPAGTGNYTVTLTSQTLSGGPDSAAAEDASGGPAWHEVIVASFSAMSGTALLVAVDDATWAAGTAAVDDVHVYAGVFDLATGNEIAHGVSGSVTLTTAGRGIGARAVGSLSADFQEIQQGSCVTDADCAPNEVCLAGSCVAGGGSDGGSGGGDGGSWQCQVDSDCPPGDVCQAGVCVPGRTGSCDGMQGTGAFTATEPAPATCGALGAIALNVASAQAFVGNMGSGAPGSGPSIFLVDPQSMAGNALSLELAACPAAAGTLSIGQGVEGYAYAEVSAGPNLELMARYKAVSGSVTFTAVGSRLTGSATLVLDNGGSASATFDVQ
jgi:hypothetical protein